MPSVGSCGSCLYWAPPAGPGALRGFCHLHPPTHAYALGSADRYLAIGDRFPSCGQTDWCGDWAQATGQSQSITLQPSNGVASGNTVALPQASISASAPFAIDSRGRLSVISACAVTVTATFTLSRSVAQGATGQGLLRFPSSSAANLSAPVVLAAALADVNGVATCTLTWTADVPAQTSFEVDYTNSASGSQDCQGGSLQVLCRAYS